MATLHSVVLLKRVESNMLPQCKGKTTSGKSCRNLAIDTSGYCRSHHPEAEKRPTTGIPFEEKVVKVLRLLGYTVERNVTMSGCQIDIYAEFRTGIIPHRLMVECKDYGNKREVGIEEVNKFVGVMSPARGKAIDKGLFVTTHGFTRHAKDYARDVGIQCVTFSDLSTELVNFDQYIDHIIAEFEDSELASSYIDLSGTEVEDYESIDPSNFHRPLDDLVDRYVFEDSRGRLALLGNFGTGKTTFCKKYSYDLARIYKEDPTSRIPILINLSEYERKQSIQEVITSTLQYGYGVRIDTALCLELQRLGKFILLFDGFDEMATNVDPNTIRDNLREINNISRIPENRFILTCRTHFFRDRVQAEVLADFDIIYIPEWGEIELKAFLQKRFGNNWKQQFNRIRGTHNLEELAQTPLFLEMIVETLPKLGAQVRRIELYRTYTDKWVKTQSHHRGARLSEDERRQFVNDLAIKLYTEDRLSCHYTEFAGILRKQFQIEDAAKIDYLQNDVRTCTFLTRDSGGNYSFRHKSFMEFFIAQTLAVAIHEGSKENLRLKPLRVEIAGFLIEFLTSNPPEKALKAWAQDTADQILRENVLLLLARLGINISDNIFEKESDENLLTKLTAQFVQGDTKAFDELFILLSPKLRRYVERSVRHKDLADDIVMDVFIRAFQRRDQLEQVTNITKYLFGIAHSKIANEYKRNRKIEFVPIDEIKDAIPQNNEDVLERLEESFEQKRRSKLLTEAMNLLPDEERKLLLLSFSGATTLEIAKKLGMEIQEARYLINRVHARIRYYLKRQKDQ